MKNKFKISWLDELPQKKEMLRSKCVLAAINDFKQGLKNALINNKKFKCIKSMKYKATVAVAMSGGVDSAVSALLLKNAGYKVFGIFMKNWEDDDQCNSREDFVDAVSVAEKLKIDILQVNFLKIIKKGL